MATSVRWKDEESREGGESEPAEGRPAQAQQGFAKAARACGTGKVADRVVTSLCFRLIIPLCFRRKSFLFLRFSFFEVVVLFAFIYHCSGVVFYFLPGLVVLRSFPLTLRF